MGLFANILDKLGIKKKVETPAASTPKTTTVAPGANSRPAPTSMAPDPSKVMPATRPAPIQVVDVVSKLETLAKANPEKLDWKVSIVDMLKLLGIDSSLEARKELAKELGCPPEKIGGDYSGMNVWLHKTVLKRIADNGGNIPANMLD